MIFMSTTTSNPSTISHLTRPLLTEKATMQAPPPSKDRPIRSVKKERITLLVYLRLTLILDVLKDVLYSAFKGDKVYKSALI